MRKSNDTTGALRWISKVSGKNKLYIVLLTLIQSLIGIGGVCYALLMRSVIDCAVEKDKRRFIAFALLFVGIIIIQVLLGAVNRHFTEKARASTENIFKSRLFKVLLTHDYQQVSSVHTAQWLNRLTSDTVVVADGLTQILPGVIGMFVKMAGAGLMILILQPILAYIMIPIGLVLLGFTYIFRRRLKYLHKRMQESDGDLRVFMQETLGSQVIVRSYSRVEEIFKITNRKMDKHLDERMNKNRFSNICNIGFSVAMYGMYVLAVVFGGIGIITNSMSYGTLTATIQLTTQLQSPLANITGFLPKFYAMTASAERLMEAEEIPKAVSGEVLDKQEISRFYQNDFLGICIHDATFTYQPPALGYADADSRTTLALKNISLNIDKGDYIAFTGASGCGKSTILKLIMNLYTADCGEILVCTSHGNVRMSNKYRKLFAYVPQGNLLMNGSIREIITFYGDCDKERVNRALKIACADEFVRDLPNGIDTMLYEHGAGLSEGQMQRIAIARAIYADCPILILDEATSALDEQTEQKLIDNLKRMTDKTVLLVTHRMSLLDICNKKAVANKNGITVETIGG